MFRRPDEYGDKFLDVGIPPKLLSYVVFAVAVLEGEVEHVALRGVITVQLVAPRADVVAAGAVDIYCDVSGQFCDVRPAVVSSLTLGDQYRNQLILRRRDVLKAVTIIDGCWVLQPNRPAVRHVNVRVEAVRHAEVEEAVVVAHAVPVIRAKRIQRRLVGEEDTILPGLPELWQLVRSPGALQVENDGMGLSNLMVEVSRTLFRKTQKPNGSFSVSPYEKRNLQAMWCKSHTRILYCEGRTALSLTKGFSCLTFEA